MIVLNKEIAKHSKTELEEMLGKLEMESHKRKDVMVNRVRYALHNGAEIETQFDEPDYDAELEEKWNKPKAEAKPEIEYEWVESPWADRQVYTSAGTGLIVSETPEGFEHGEFFLVRLADGTEKAVNQNTTRFKAINDEYRDRYIKDTSVLTPSGSPSIHSGSDISYAMLGMDMGQLYQVAKENGLEEKFLSYVEREKPLNNGMVRMNIGNILKGMHDRGEAITILGDADIGIAAQKGKKRGEEIAKRVAKEKAEAKAKREAEAEAKAAEKEAKKAEKEAAKAEKAEAQAEKKAAKKTKAKTKKTKADKKEAA